MSGMSASRSMTLAMEAGMASCVGAAGVGAVEGAGSEAAIAAAIDGAAAILNANESGLKLTLQKES